jgi:hypothetical protein
MLKCIGLGYVTLGSFLLAMGPSALALDAQQPKIYCSNP